MAVDLPARGPALLRGELRATTVGMLILVTLIAFEAMAVAPALPTAARDLHGLGAYGWAFTGFLVANVVGMVVAGQVCDARGPRLPLTAGMVAFLGGLLTSGTAVGMPQFVAGRVVQGLGSGLVVTAIYVLIGEKYPEQVRPRLFAAFSTAWVVPSLVGPVVSGAVTQHGSWRWVFLGLVPFVLVGSALMLPVLRSLAGGDARSSGPLADPRRVLRAVAVAAGIAALEGAGQHVSPASLGLAVAGFAALAWGLRSLLPAGTFSARRGVPGLIAVRGLLAGAFFGVESLVPLAMTVQHGFSPTAAGLPLACSGLSWALGSWWQGREHAGDDGERRVRLVRAGVGCIAVAAVAVAIAGRPSVPGVLVYPAWALAGLGAGLAMSSLSVLLLRYTSEAERGSDSAALQLSDATSSALTTGLAGVLVAAVARGVLGYTAAFTAFDLAMAAVALVGLRAAGRVRAPC